MLPRRLWLWAWVLVGSSICSTSRAAQLYWIDAGRGAIQRSNTDGTAVETVVTGPGVSGGIAVDAAAGWIYWSQSFGSTGGSIQRSRLDGSDRHTIIADQTDRPIGVAVNPGSGELFWTTTNASGTTGSIRRSASDGTSPQTVYQGSLRQPFGITLDPTAGVVFWSDVGNAAIQRSNFDGSGFQTLIASGLMNPRAITLDPVSQTLFWTDNLARRIERSRSDGSERTTLFSYSTPDGIVFNQEDSRIYWADFASGQILRANADGTGVEVAITGLANPRYLAIVPEPNTPLILAMAAPVLLLHRRRRHG